MESSSAGLKPTGPSPTVYRTMTRQTIKALLLDKPTSRGGSLVGLSRRRARRWTGTVRASRGLVFVLAPGSVIHKGGLHQTTSCHTCGYDSRTTISSTSRSKRDLCKLLGEGCRL